jgi:hypothetical protein
MSRLVIALFVSIAIAVPATLQAQQPSQPVQDPQAVAVLQTAIAALGGANNIAQVQTVIAQGSMSPAPGVTNAPSGNFTWEDQFTSQGHEFQDSFQSAAFTQRFVSGHGSPGVVSNGRIRKFTPHVAQARLPLHLPALILAGLLANSNYSIAFVGPVTLNGAAAIKIHLHIDTDIVSKIIGRQDWYFDPGSGLPIRVEYRVPDTTNPAYYVTAAADFSNYQPIQGVTFPMRILATQDGSLRNVLTISSLTVNPPVASSDFDLPTASGQ